MDRVIFRDLPGIAEIEQEYLLYLNNRLMKPEREELERKIGEKSVELFGITEDETDYWQLPVLPMTLAEWEGLFEFIFIEHDEENDFWDFFGIDVTDAEGVQLACIYAFGRQLVCALRKLHPDAVLTFRPTTDQGIEAAAEAWGKRLLARGR